MILCLVWQAEAGIMNEESMVGSSYCGHDHFTSTQVSKECSGGKKVLQSVPGVPCELTETPDGKNQTVSHSVKILYFIFKHSCGWS